MALTALFTGASGLAANSTALDVVGNNLANMNTTGYKTQRALFQDLVYQQLDFGSAGDGAIGGTNATQIGFGVKVGAIDSVFLQGAVNPTGRPLDVALQGSGFFVVRGISGNQFTRAGSFAVDANGFLVDGSTGGRVQRTGTVGEGGPGVPAFQVPGVNDIKVPFGAGAAGVPTANVRYQGNLNKDMLVGDTQTTSIQVYDSQSGPHSLNVTFTKTGVNTFSASATIPGATVTTPPTPITFDTGGYLVSPATLPISVTGIPGAAAQTITLNLGVPGQAVGLSQFGGASDVTALTQDGTAAGSLTQVSIDQNGNLQGQFTNGRTVPLAQLSIAAFNNTAGLIRVGQNYFASGPGSGEPLYGTAGSGGRGLIQGSSLEGSNVDIAVEFSRLIIAQRGFQINSRTITAANETLQELANIIR